jgi:DNA modification methylase
MIASPLHLNGNGHDADGYTQLLQSKIQVYTGAGFEVNPAALHPSLFPHQRDAVQWALRHGRALIACSFGLGKSRMQIDLMRIIHERTGRPTLVVCPLGVRHQFSEEDGPAMGVRFQYVRTDAEVQAADTPYLITNYERVRDSSKAGNLTLHPHHEREFWHWVASWALFITKPSDLGYSDEGYELPDLHIHWHRIATDHERAWDMTDNRGQRHLFVDSAASIQQAIREKRASLSSRVQKAAEIVETDDPAKHWLIWHHLEDERLKICAAIPDAVDVYGSQELEERERRIVDFSHGRFRILAVKPEIAGSGCNFQRHCHSNVFLGVDYKFQDFIQAIHRTHRFQQKQPVEVHIIHTDAEDQVVQVLKRKWRKHDELVAKMTDIIKRYGLSHEALKRDLQRTIGVTRREERGAYYTAVNNDCVDEVRRLADNSIDLIHTSIPFGNHFEYSASYNDFGHNPTDDDFWRQMDYLTPHLLRVLKPGRIAAIHVKDRLLYGHQNGLGVMSLSPFSDETTAHFRKHGFIFFGRITVVTDVVRENASTYRLGWTENCKDSTKMGVGLPEYILLFRKRQTDTSRAYADEPVTKDKAIYTRSQWQIDAHSFWRSSGDRLLHPHELDELDPERLAGMETGQIYRWWQEYSRTHIYDYRQHIAYSQALEDAGRLPSGFMLFPPQAPAHAAEHVWTDIVFMRTLNSDQSQARKENHLCPLPLDIVERIVGRYSNEGDLILDPFAGLGTVPYVAVQMGRRGYGIELSDLYWECSLRYLREAEAKRRAPSLLDLLDTETNAASGEVSEAA